MEIKWKENIILRPIHPPMWNYTEHLHALVASYIPILRGQQVGHRREEEFRATEPHRADYFYGEIPCARNLTKEELKDYEVNTGVLIADLFKGKDYEAIPGVLCKNHGPFTWGKDGHEAVHNAVVVEEVAKMAAHCEIINPNVKPAPQELLDKHYFRKHGANSYYGQK